MSDHTAAIELAKRIVDPNDPSAPVWNQFEKQLAAAVLEMAGEIETLRCEVDDLQADVPAGIMGLSGPKEQT